MEIISTKTVKSSRFKIIGGSVLFCLLFFLLDRSIAFILSCQYSRIYTGPGRYNFIKENRFDCLIMGSSTSTCYYQAILSRRLGMTVLNVGLDGSALIYSKCLLELVIQNKVAPNFIILNVDLFELLSSSWSGNYFSLIDQFRPLYGQNESIDRALYKDKPFEFLKYISHSYRYNDMLLSFIQKRVQKHKAYSRELSPVGVMQLPIDDKTVADKFSNYYDIDHKKLALYKAFINVCKQHNIQVLLIESPIYYPTCKMTTRDKQLETMMYTIAQECDVPFIPITQDTHGIFKDHSLFKDVLHLNDRGSVIFSEIVCNELSKVDMIQRVKYSPNPKTFD